MSYWFTTALPVVISVVCALPPHPHAQEAEDLRAKAQNPVASMISLPPENNIDFGAPDGTAYV